jgi:chromatin segregation and condensation protein Rec8/ScpA/Scc1 (kleisin family)
MADIKIKELPSKIKEIKKENHDQDEESLEALVEQLRAHAAQKASAPLPASRPTTTAPVLRKTNLVQEVSGKVSRSETRETEKVEARPVVYEGTNKTKYESTSSRTNERAYQAPNSERKYTSEKTSKEESRKVSPVLSEDIRQTGSQDRNKLQGFNTDKDRDYEINTLAEDSDKRKSRRL